jgi:hypothetical protein
MLIGFYFKSIVELMLSFELSAIDIVLLVAVLILLSLYVTKRSEVPRKSRSQEAETHETREKSNKAFKSKKSKTITSEPQTGFQNCLHHFGYLKSLPKNTPVPDECFGCPKVMECLFPNEQPKKLLF